MIVSASPIRCCVSASFACPARGGEFRLRARERRLALLEFRFRDIALLQHARARVDLALAAVHFQIFKFLLKYELIAVFGRGADDFGTEVRYVRRSGG